ncbi:hypothetical protein SPHINGO391_460060 [Sphingomonas aurantiaca]|uniref:Uncharacterized protein n=1 Tax=Sphingomonas aurantiaca TaxID=185949 RepID=A0A5E7ZJP5_9SPHN|nr:hypothetical protein SPHINGO391_460060 [Sphingomonas aurantiaca]
MTDVNQAIDRPDSGRPHNDPSPPGGGGAEGDGGGGHATEVTLPSPSVWQAPVTSPLRARVGRRRPSWLARQVSAPR